MSDFGIIVVGAGAAGLLAAISAGGNGEKVLVVEKNERAARKLMITGKGRCNITNSADIKEFMGNIYPEPRFLYPAFKNFFSSDIISMLERASVDVVLERGGRYFPASGKAVDVVDALVTTAKENGVKFLFSTEVTGISVENGAVLGVKIRNSRGESMVYSDKVVVCTGGKSYPLTGSTGDGFVFAEKCGHSVSTPQPALVPLVGSDNFFADLDGLILKNVSASLFIDGKKLQEQFGEMLFMNYGVSGPIVLTLSRWAVIALCENKSVRLSVDLKPALDEKKLDARIIRDLNANGKQKLGFLFRNWLPRQLIPTFVSRVNLNIEKLACQLTGEERRRIVSAMKNFSFDIVGHRGFAEAIVTSGGVSVDEINPKTMESKLVKGLFFAGEVLNVDANTGGYNLQIAYSTGWLAGQRL